MSSASSYLPPEYQPVLKIDLRHGTGFLVWMNIIATISLVPFGWLFYKVMDRVRPGSIFSVFSWGVLQITIGLLIAYILTITLHELAHGLAFRWLGGIRPIYGFKVVYAFAAAPGTYFPRDRYLFIGLAPIVLLTLLGILLTPFIPAPFVGLVWFALTANASGAMGDLYVVGRLLLLHPPEALVEDEGDVLTVYQPAEG
jgi:hypothetical protein